MYVYLKKKGLTLVAYDRLATLIEGALNAKLMSTTKTTLYHILVEENSDLSETY